MAENTPRESQPPGPAQTLPQTLPLRDSPSVALLLCAPPHGATGLLSPCSLQLGLYSSIVYVFVSANFGVHPDLLNQGPFRSSVFCFVFNFWWCGLSDLRSPTRDQSLSALCTGSVES